MDGDLQKAFLTLVKCVRDPTGLRSNKVQEALADGETKTAARVILTKDKAQLDELTAAYKKSHKVDVADEIEKKCKGEVKTLVLAKLGRVTVKKSPQKAPAKEKPKGKPAAQTDKKSEKPAEKTKEEKEDEEAEKDADELHKAIEAGDKDKIVDILAKHCDEKPKLQKLKDKYKAKHDQDLLEAVKPKLDGDLQEAVEALLMEDATYDAKSLYNAMKGIGTDEDVLIEIICARNNAELADIRETYNANYGRSLEKDIKGDTSGDFEDLLVELSKGKRDESTKVDKSLAKKDAEALLQAGYLGTDENKFIQVFTQRSFPHLKVMFAEYKKIANSDMDEVIEEEMNQDLEKGFLSLVKYIRDPSKFYADKLLKSLNDGDTETAGRIILTSSKAELADIIGGYKKHHGKDLVKDAETKFSDPTKKLVMAKLKKANQEQKEKEKAAANDPNAKKAAGGKQTTAVGRQDSKKAAKPAADKPAGKRDSQKKIEQPVADNQDFSELRKAIDAGDKKKVKEIILRNLTDKAKAKKLVDDYNARYGKELLEMLEGKLEEDLIEATAALSLTKAQHDARSLHEAMQGMGTKELVLIETFATRTNADIAAIRQEYKKKYRKELEQDIRDETSGDFETLLVELCKGQRDESTEVSDDLAHKDAETLLEAGIKKWGTDEEKFIEIFTTRSIPQLKAMLPEYKKWAKCEIEDTIDSEMSGDLHTGLKALITCIRDQDKFIADKLHVLLQSKSMADVTRIILGTGEKELAEMEKTYNSTYQPKLAAEVEKTSSNDLKNLLLAKLKDTEPDKEPQKDADRNNYKPQPTRKPSGKAEKPSEPTGDEKPVEHKPDDEKPVEHKPDDEKPVEHKPDDEKPVEHKPVESAKTVEQAEEPAHKEEPGNKEGDASKKDRPKLNIKKTEYHATLKPAEKFDAADDAAKLKSAMKGFGSDEDAIIAILGARTSAQRQQIAAKFQEEYDKNLLDELKSELGGKFEDAIVALMSSPELNDANSLHDAMSGLGTDESVLIEILCSRSDKEIQAIKAVFKEVHGKDLIEEVKDETSGDLQTTLISLAQGKRDSSEEVNEDLAYEDATKLFEAGENKWGTEESVFVKILTTRSLIQLQATFEAYKHVAKRDIMDSVNEELTGDFHGVIEAIVRCARNPPLFFAEVLEKELGGLTVDSTNVTRVVVARAEIDLAEIKSEYEKKTGKPLKEVIKNCLKGDLETMLLQIVGD